MKVEREKIIDYSYQSRMPDIGLYKKKFKLKRKSPKLDTAFVATKAALMGGNIPTSRGDALLVDAIATLSVYFEPLDDKGVETFDNNWVDDLLDQEIMFDLYKKFMAYQDSFYPTPEVKEGADEQAPVQS